MDLPYLDRSEREPVGLETSRIGLSAGSIEHVERSADLRLGEPDRFDERLPSVTGRPAGDSGGPQIDVGDGRLRHGLAVGDVVDLEDAARPEHPVDLGQGHGLVDDQVDDAVADDSAAACLAAAQASAST